MARERSWTWAPAGVVALGAALAVAGAATLLAESTARAEEPGSWFDRPPLKLSVGRAEAPYSLTFYGFIEADAIWDSTRSYGDSIGDALVARSDTYDGRASRAQTSMRNSRLGLGFEAPAYGRTRAAAVLEGDFFGTQHGPPATSEAAFYGSPTFRVRHAFLKVQTPFVDVLAGQTYDVFGWQNYFFPCTAEYLGLPNMVFSRDVQARLQRTFAAGAPVSVDVAVSAARPAQRDSSVPDGHAGVRLSASGWRGITTPGNVGTIAAPLSLGISGVIREFKVNAFAPPPTQSANSATGWGVSIDALVPVIPAEGAADRRNRLTLTGAFVVGSGIGDLINARGGATFPTLPNPTQATPPPVFDADIDDGLVSFDTRGVLHTIDWRAFRAGLQYYAPPGGRLIFSANYTEARSSNMRKLFPMGGAEIELLGRVADTSRYADVNVFFDATPSVRVGLSGQYTQVHYLDGDQPDNLRAMGQANYLF
jgi:hypothetical protein